MKYWEKCLILNNLHPLLKQMFEFPVRGHNCKKYKIQIFLDNKNNQIYLCTLSTSVVAFNYTC